MPILKKYCLSIIAFLFLLFTNFTEAVADGLADDNLYEDMAKNFAWVRYGQGAGSAVGNFLLVRHEKDICAIRFTAFHRDHDKKAANFFSSGAENMYGEYEWLYQGDGSFDFTRENVMAGSGKLHHGPIYWLGHGIVLKQPAGRGWVECGPFKFAWSYPVGLGFWSYASSGKPVWDAEAEFAPTRWTKRADIDPKNGILKWVNGIEHGQTEIEWLPAGKLP